MGIVVPKVKQAMTNAFRMKEGKEPIPDKNSPDGKFHEGWADKFVAHFIKYDENEPLQNNMGQNRKNSAIPSMAEFINSSRQTTSSPSFTGGLNLKTIFFCLSNLWNKTTFVRFLY